MSVGGVGGAGRAGGLEPEGVDRSPSGAAEIAGATAVRGVGETVPRMVGSAVLAFDAKTHHRNVPDLSYGGILDGKKNADGSWTVRVASFPTTIAGPRPGAKPFDIAAYTFKDGKVTEAAGGGPGPGKPGYDDAVKVERELGANHAQAATKAAEEALGKLVLGGLGFPRVNQNPDPKELARFGGMLAKLDADGKLDDLKRAVETEEKRRIDGFGGRRPMDWYGPLEVMNAAVNAFGTAEQKRVWNKPPAGGPTPASPSATDIEYALAAGDTQKATEMARKAGNGLYGPGLGFPRLVENPKADDVAWFKAVLSGLERDGKLDDLRRAVDAEEKREIDGFGGRRPMDWYGPREILSTLVNKYGSASQKRTWTAGTGGTGGGGGTTPVATGGAKEIEAALKAGDSKKALDVGYAAIRNVMLPNFGFPRIKEDPDPADVANIKKILSGLAKDKKLDDFARAVVKEQKAALDRFGGRRPMDWFGPQETFGAVVAKFGTKAQKDTYEKAIKKATNR